MNECYLLGLCHDMMVHILAQHAAVTRNKGQILEGRASGGPDSPGKNPKNTTVQYFLGKYRLCLRATGLEPSPASDETCAAWLDCDIVSRNQTPYLI